MPRKQRFKPTRKPQANPKQANVNSQVDDRKEIHPDDVETGEPARSYEHTDVEKDTAR